MLKENNKMNKIISLAKRRGFIFPSSEIYGGLSSTYDYGPFGVELKNNIKKAWWKEMVKKRQDIVGFDSAILMAPKVWEASGHLSAGFADQLVECKACHHRFKKDDLKENKCPDCGNKLSKEKKFNLMMKTYLGVMEDESSKTYLRPETCQGIYVNFKNIIDSMHLNLPFGVAQIGKAFRNEITLRNFIFRTREFEQMEMQYFIEHGKNKEVFDSWKKQRENWYLSLGIKKENLRFRKHKKDELAHYAKVAEDIEYNFPFGWKELEGIHNRSDWDLKNHNKYSGEQLEYFDQEKNKSFIPHIIETSGGVDRSFLSFICDAYTEDKAPDAGGKMQERVVLKLHKDLAPIKIAILPLLRKPELNKVAKKIFDDIKNRYMCWYDETQSIGKRYRRQDEIGTPYCITIDFDSLKDKAVTVRERDTMKQERVKVDELEKYFEKKLKC